MLATFEQIALLLGFAAIGYLLCRCRVIRAEFAGILSALCVYLFLPCSMFRTFTANFTVAYFREKYVFLLTGVALLALVSVLCILLARFLAPRKTYQWSLYHYSLNVPNTGYVGYALVGALYGEIALLNMMVFCIPLGFYTYTVGTSMLLDGKNHKPWWRQLINPINVAMLIGMAFGLLGWQMPSFVDKLTLSASNAFSPVAMLLIGITVSEYDWKSLLTNGRVYAAVAFRLLLIPAIVLALTTLVGLPVEVRRIALIAYALPCGCNTIVFPKLIGEDCRGGAALVFLSTVLSIATLPLWCWLVG